MIGGPTPFEKSPTKNDVQTMAYLMGGPTCFILPSLNPPHLSSRLTRFRDIDFLLFSMMSSYFSFSAHHCIERLWRAFLIWCPDGSCTTPCSI